MRVRALFVIVTVAGLLAVPASIAQAGGNWLDIRRDDGVPGGRWETWSGPYLPGTALEVRTTVYARGAQPTNRLRELGPYFAWIAPEGGHVDEHGIPADAIRLSAFRLHWTSEHFATAHASIVIPALPSGRYTIEVCNDPCTFSGFGAYVQGWTRILQSAEAVKLQHRNERIQKKIYQARKDAGRLSDDVETLQGQLDDAEGARASLAERVVLLGDQLDAARARAEAATEPVHRTLIDPWVGVMLAAALLALTATIRFRYRAQRIVVPDTLEELLRSDGFELRSAKR